MVETVICPKCGKPFPKKRLELGYNYCCNCSTEKKLVSITEGTLEGEDTNTVMHIVRPEVARAYFSASAQSPVSLDPVEDEVDPIELRAIIGNTAAREAKFEELESSFLENE